MGEVFEAHDADAVEAVIQDIYGWKQKFCLDSGRRSAYIRLEGDQLTPQVRLDRVAYGMSFSVSRGPLGVPAVLEMQSGHITYTSGGTERPCGPGDVCLAVLPEDPFTCRGDEPRFTLATLDPVLLSQVADTEPHRTQQPVQLLGCAPVSAQAAQRWKDTCAFIRDTVLASPDAAGQPLLAARAGQLLAAAALATFPNNALTEPTIEDRHDAHPDTLRRAEAFIEENAHTDITPADIAAACSVTIRTIQVAFRRHLDTTPTDYLRRVRLDHAHHDLLTGDPAHESVTAVAYRWAFPSASRFAARYRAAYGVLPSQTLRRR